MMEISNFKKSLVAAGVILLAAGMFLWAAMTSQPSKTPQTPEIRQTPETQFKVGAASLDTPDELAVYQLKPAPFELFSPESAQKIAQALGFTSNATAKTLNNLYLYSEEGKSLNLHRLAGTISYQVDLSKLNKKGPIDQTEALKSLLDTLNNLGFNQDFYNWEKAPVAAYTFSEQGVRQTSLQGEVMFLEFKPNLVLNDYPLRPPYPIYAWVSAENQLIALSLWYPNLAWDTPGMKLVIPLKTVWEQLQKGQAEIVFSKGDINTTELNLSKVEIIYMIEPEATLDFSQTRWVKPYYRFYSKEGEVLVKAVEK